MSVEQCKECGCIGSHFSHCGKHTKTYDHCDIILRHSGAVGWLGLLIDEFGNELYRTGKHWPSAKDALTAVQLWINPIEEKAGNCT